MKTITVIIVPKTRAYNIAALKITEDGYMMYATINNTEGIDIPMILRNVTHPGEITSKKKRAINGTYNISVLIVILVIYGLYHTPFIKNPISLNSRNARKIMLQKSNLIILLRCLLKDITEYWQV